MLHSLMFILQQIARHIKTEVRESMAPRSDPSMLMDPDSSTDLMEKLGIAL